MEIFKQKDKNCRKAAWSVPVPPAPLPEGPAGLPAELPLHPPAAGGHLRAEPFCLPCSVQGRSSPAPWGGGGALQAPGRAGGDKLTGALGPSLRADGTSVSCALSQGEEFPVLSGKRMGLLRPPVSDGLPLQWAFLFQTIRGCAASQCWGCAWPEGRRGLVCGQPVG